MKLSPSTIAANLSAAAAAEAEAAASTNLTTNSTVTTSNINTTVNMSSTSIPFSSTNLNSGSMTTSLSGRSIPKDSQVIAAIFKEMGIVEYEPRVLPQLVEFAYRYASRVLEDAQLYSSYAKKKVIDTDDVSLSVQMQVDRSFVGPPSRDVLLEIARNKNTQPLPPIKSHNGMRLPADRYSLVASNLRLASNNKPPCQNNQNKPKTSTSLLSGGTFVNSKIATINSNNSNKISNGTSQMPTNTFLGATDILHAKRKLDDN